MRHWNLAKELALLTGAVIALASCTSAPNLPSATPTPTSASLPTSTPKPAQIIVNPPDELNLSIQDFPVGWQVNSKDFTAEGAHTITVVKAQAGFFSTVLSGLVVSTVWVYPSSSDAHRVLAEQLSEYSQRYAIGDPRIGDESWMFSDAGGFEVRFRVLNVVAQVQMSSPIYGGSMDETTRWAKRLRDKVESKKRMGLIPVRPGASASTPTDSNAPGLAATPTAVLPTPTPTPDPVLTDLAAMPKGELTAFVSKEDGTPKIYLTTNDATLTAPLVRMPSWSPAWSPDGSMIAFVSEGDIWVTNIDGSGLRNLTNTKHPIAESAPVWSPDGQMIAYEWVDVNVGNTEIYVMGASGQNKRNISNSGGQDEHPAWSPDSTRLAFDGPRVIQERSLTVHSISIAPAAGGGSTRLSTGDQGSRFPSWVESNGTEWVYYYNGAAGLYKIKAAGGNPELIHDGQIHGPLLASPDRRYLAYVRDGNLYALNLELDNGAFYPMVLGGFSLQLTSGGGDTYPVNWSADSRKLAYYFNDSSGREQTRIVDILSKEDHPFDGYSPSWQPRGHEADSLTPRASPTPVLPMLAALRNGRLLAFQSCDGGSCGIYLTDGSVATLLTLGYQPTWSPDGSKIAFGCQVNAGQPGDVCIINKDGTGLRNLTEGQGGNSPKWSPDMTKVAFLRQRAEGSKWSDLWVMNADGTNVAQLTDTPERNEAAPTWSPDGTLIAFLSEHPGHSDSYVAVINSDGASLVAVSDPKLSAGLPHWMPDGVHLIFSCGCQIESYRSGGGYNLRWAIYVADSDGTTLTELYDHPTPTSYVVPSPDGKLLAVSDLTVMKADGSGVNRLLQHKIVEGFSWSADSSKIGFATREDTGMELWIVNVDGTGLTRLTHNRFEESSPMWQPSATDH